MNRRINKIFIVVMICAFVLSIFSGCSQSQNATDNPSSETASDSNTSSKEDTSKNTSSDETVQAESYKTPGEISYPIDTDETLTIWSTHNQLQKSYLTQEESPFHSELNKKTGINVKWEWPAPGADANQSFNLLIASGDYPDIIYTNIVADAQNLINDGVIIPLNEILPDYAPNLWKYLQENERVSQNLKTDEGNYYMFPWLREDTWLCTFAGPIVRKDWLEEQGLDIPTTIDEVENVLYTFKDAYGARFAAVDLPWKWSVEIAGAYGIDRKSFYIDNDVVKYGPAEPAYKEYLSLMVKWYKDGLIDPDFATIDSETLQTKILNDEIGYTVASSGDLTNWSFAIEQKGGTAEFAACRQPVLQKGDKIKFVQAENMPDGKGAAITTACKNVELAARFLDYGYSEEGKLYWNFGTEGVSYEMVDGRPTYTDTILNDPEGVSQALDKYIGTQWGGISIQSKEMFIQKNSPLAVEAVDVWVGDTDPFEVKLPLLIPTVEESTEQSALQNAIDTYVSEMFYKFVLGEESLDNFDDYIATLESMGLPRLLEIKQNQYNRYLAR